jgi:hypothetical protein
MAETAHAVRCYLALSANASQWLAAAPSMHVFDAVCPHNKIIALFLDDHA